MAGRLQVGVLAALRCNHVCRIQGLVGGMSAGMWKVQHLCRVPQAKQAGHTHELLTVRAAKSVSPLCRSRFSDPPMPRWGSPGCPPARI